MGTLALNGNGIGLQPFLMKSSAVFRITTGFTSVFVGSTKLEATREDHKQNELRAPFVGDAPMQQLPSHASLQFLSLQVSFR